MEREAAMGFGLRTSIVLPLVLAAAVAAAQAQESADLKAALEANNAEWLQAYNSQNADALAQMYTEDAVLIAAGEQPIRGADAIHAYWQTDVQDYSDHTWEILEVRGEDDLAYQIAEWTVAERSGGATYSGNTVRILERQADGQWLTRLHMFSVHD
jgi:uncharacterized protein (TIGR02246 family)